ncbi:uncharacterized protein LOC133286019 [Gastrolobium bilobum]|uniref:uncharacterized protein LOC133286019 n=1 Tax=Gastrolobium bilobum TaxID=150636 RepID=UPI002AB0C895|nr:uncharacterized protein LOC133286019 [Gastrolobium bilobum]
MAGWAGPPTLPPLLVRDEKGNWVRGFTYRIRVYTPLIAELWAILKGLKMVWDCGARKLIVEGDSSLAMGAIAEGDDNGNIAQLLEEMRIGCAEFLAHFHCNIDDLLSIHQVPPANLEWMLAQEMGSVSS